MALDLPHHGDLNWDTKLVTALQSLDANLTTLNTLLASVQTLLSTHLTDETAHNLPAQFANNMRVKV